MSGRCLQESPAVSVDCGTVNVTIGGDCGSSGVTGPPGQPGPGGPAGPQGEPGPPAIVADVEPPLPPDGWPIGMLWINPAL